MILHSAIENIGQLNIW